MRRAAFGLILLVVLTAHLCVSPFSILSVKSPPADGRTAYEAASTVRDILPFTFEEKARFTPFSLVMRIDIHVVQDLPAPQLLGFVLRPVTVRHRLGGFELPVSERPPPSRA